MENIETRKFEDFDWMAEPANAPCKEIDSVVWTLPNLNMHGCCEAGIREFLVKHRLKRNIWPGGLWIFMLGDAKDHFDTIMERLQNREIVTKYFICVDYLSIGPNRERAISAIQELFDMGVIVVFTRYNFEVDSQEKLNEAMQAIQDAQGEHLGERF